MLDEVKTSHHAEFFLFYVHYLVGRGGILLSPQDSIQRAAM